VTDDTLEALPEWARPLFASWEVSERFARKLPSKSWNSLQYGSRETKNKHGRLLLAEPAWDKQGVLFRTLDHADGRLRIFAQANSAEEARGVLDRFMTGRFRAPATWAAERSQDALVERQTRRRALYFTKRGAVWRLLEKHGVATASFSWSGSGDSGGLDEAEYLDASGKHVQVPQGVTDEIDESAQTALELGFDNEGSEGTLSLDVKARTANGSVGYPETIWHDRALHKPRKRAKSPTSAAATPKALATSTNPASPGKKTK
jgi:hypothetical protein